MNIIYIHFYKKYKVKIKKLKEHIKRIYLNEFIKRIYLKNIF